MDIITLRFLARRALFVFVAIVVAINVAYATVSLISPDALRLLVLKRTPGLTIIDVRPPSDFAKSHIQGAKNVPAATVQTAGLPRTAQIVVYCSEAECPLSAGAANRLLADGYPKVELLAGGFAEWIKKGYPVQNAANVPVVHNKHAVTLTKDARAKVQNGAVLPLDVRPAAEFSAGHLPHAQSAPLEQLDIDMVRLPKGQEILVYDRQAARSRQAADKLKAAGFKVSELSGGIAGWTKRGNALVTKE